MKRSEISILLAKISAFDQRTIGDADVIAWQEALGDDVPLPDALVVVTDHFRKSHDRIMPIHIIEAVRAARRELLRRAGTPPIPGDLDQAQERAWAKLWCSAVKDGDPDPIAVANHAMRITPEVTGSISAERREQLIRRLAESKGIPK